MIKGAIFDMDGVLADNTPIHVAAYKELCTHYGVETSGKDWTKVYGKGNDTILPYLLPEEVLEREGIDKLGDEKESIYRDLAEKQMRATPGLVNFLDELKKAGIKIAVGSSGPQENVEFTIKTLGIADKFDALVNGDMVTRRKPDPEIFMRAARELGLSPEECIVFEDAIAGLQAAKSAGMQAVALATSMSADQLRDHFDGTIISNFTEITYDDIADM